MTHLTIRNIPPEVGEALERRRVRSRSSLNQTVIDLLSHALGVRGPAEESNGLRRAWPGRGRRRSTSGSRPPSP